MNTGSPNPLQIKCLFLYRVYIFTLSYCYFLLLELSLCFTKIVKSGKSSEMSIFEIQVRFSWSLVMFLGVSDDVVKEFSSYFTILEGLFTTATNLC